MNLDNFDALQQRFEFVHQNFYQLCRFCLESKNLLTIFYQADPAADDSRDENAAEWVYNDERNIGNLLQRQYIQFNPEDEYSLPNNICERCVDCLVQWHRFQESFISTTKLLIKVRDHFGVVIQAVDQDDNQESDDQEEDSEYEEEIPEDNDFPEGNEIFEIEILNNLPENETVDNFTIIETVNEIEDFAGENGEKVVIDSDSMEDMKQILILKSEKLKSEPSSNEKKQKPTKHRRKTKSKIKELSSKPQLTPRGEQCPICGMIVKAKMKHHLLRHSDPAGQPFKCPDCDKSYAFKRTLADHIRQVHQNIRYGCELCGKEFVSRDVLRIHKKLHTNEEHRCGICHQVFQQRMYLRKHMAVHDMKKFNCDDCGKIFRFKEQLKQHIRVHTGEKPFKCESCPKSFRTSSHLKQHMRSHTQEKVFKCKQCRAEYANKKSLERHVAGTHS